MDQISGTMASGNCSSEDIALDSVPSWSRQTSIATMTSHGSRPKPPSRQRSIKEFKRSMKRSVADFFGVGEENPEEQAKWMNRSINLACKPIGAKVKMDHLQRTPTVDSVFETGSQASGPSAAALSLGAKPLPTPYDPLAKPRAQRQDSRVSHCSYQRQFSRQISAASSRRSIRAAPSRRTRKDSVLKMAYDGVKSMISDEQPTHKKRESVIEMQSSLRRKVPSRTSSRKKKIYMHSRSFTPTSISSYMEEDAIPKSPAVDSVFNEDSMTDDVFFDVPTPTSPLVGGSFNLSVNGSVPRTDFYRSDFYSPHGDISPAAYEEAPPLPPKEATGLGLDLTTPHISIPGGPSPPPPPLPIKDYSDLRPTKGGWQVGRRVPSPAPGTPDIDFVDSQLSNTQRIKDTVLDNVFDNSDRRQIGKGLVGRLFKRSYRGDRINSDIRQQLDEIDDHRPYFTYWMTFVQILIYIIAVSVYGIAPPGFEETEVRGEVMKASLAIERVSYFEKDNFWIGPRQADLIHLGAKYSPCMRKDGNVEEAIMQDKLRENQTACCIKNDGSGCVQSSEGRCSVTLSTWFKWSSEEPGSNGRTAGSVCGQDPRFCLHPTSSGAFQWQDDITKWPVCTKSSSATKKDENLHMTCEVVGRPCCIGIQGECIITTREHCQFRRGYFHEEALLCSQVSCMNEICGMIPFLDPDRPDQFYRLWTSLFLHAGLLQLVITVLFQFFIMRDLEKLGGWLRVAIIYLASGVAGSLSSAIFLPYHVEAGPAGAQFGLLACLFTEVIQNWYILQHPWWSIAKLGMILIFLFVIGLLPMVDNYAHLVGFVFGFLLSFALLPYVTFGKFDRRRKLAGIILCLVTAMGLFATLIILFYVAPIYNCPYCHYFNCIPFTSKFCKTMEVKIGREGLQ